MDERRIEVEKGRVARSFLKGMMTYDRQAQVQRLVNERLIGLLQQLNRVSFGTVLEVGCCTGMFTEMFCRNFKHGQLYINDLVAEFHAPVTRRLPDESIESIVPWFGDIESRQLPGNLSLIVSSSTLQWLTDLGGFFSRAAASLDDGGVLAISMFGQETMHELAELIGVGLDYHPFPLVRDMLDRRLRIIHSGIDRDQMMFGSPAEVLRHIQETGVGGVGGYKWTPRRLEQFDRQYRHLFGSDDGVTLSYVSYSFVACKRGQ